MENREMSLENREIINSYEKSGRSRGNKINITNVLLAVISVLVAAIGYFYQADREEVKKTQVLVQELVGSADSNRYANTAEHLVLYNIIATHMEKAGDVYNKEIVVFKEKVLIVEERLSEQALQIQENKYRSIDNKRRLDNNDYSFAESDTLSTFYYGLK